MDLKKVLFIKRLGLLGLTSVVNALMSIILIPIFTKGKPLEDYGLWVQITVSLSLVSGLTCLGLPYTLVRYIAGEKDKNKIKEAVYSIFFVVLIVNATLSPLFAYLIFKYFGGNELEIIPKIIPIFAILLFIHALSMVGWNYLRAMQRIKKTSLLTIVQNLLVTIGVGYAITNDYGIYGAILALFSVSLLMLIILFYEIISDLGLYKPKFIYLREFLKFGLPTIPSNFSAWIVSSSDRYLIGYFLGIKYVAYYNPAYSLGCLLNFIIGPLGFLLPATLSKLYEERKIDEVRLYLKYLLKYYLMIAIPAVFGISILAKPILTILSTQEIAENSHLIVPFISTSIMLFGIYTITFQILILKKRTDIAARTWIIAAILNFFLNIVFIPKFGIIGAATTTLIAYVFTVAVIVKYSLKMLAINLKMSDILKSLTSALIMSLLLQLLPMDIEEIYGIILTIILGSMTYFAFLLILRGFTKREVKYVISLIKKVLGTNI